MELRDVTPADLDEILQVRLRSFGLELGDRVRWREQAAEVAAAGRYLCVAVGDRPVAAARIWDFQQYWHGRRVSVAGVAGVVVAPEFRGLGVAGQLLRGIHDRARELGHPLAALYPATASLYRRLGYEYAGVRQRWTFPADQLRSLPRGGVQVRRGGPADAARLLSIVDHVRTGGHESGPLLWTERRVREWLEEENSFCYLAQDGFVVYGWDGRDLDISELVADSPETATALLSVVGSGASTANRVRIRTAPQDPIHQLLPEEADHDTHVQRWVVRLLDAPAAIEARGWPSSTRLEVALQLDDPDVPANDGAWLLSVGEGRGTLTPAAGQAQGALRLGRRGLAALYAGTPLAALRRSGLASGGDADRDHRVDTAFATPTPYLLDYF